MGRNEAAPLTYAVVELAASEAACVRTRRERRKCETKERQMPQRTQGRGGDGSVNHCDAEPAKTSTMMKIATIGGTCQRNGRR